MLTLAKSVKTFTSGNDSVVFFDDNTVQTVFENEQDSFVSPDFLLFVEAVMAAYKKYNVVDNLQELLELFDIVSSFDKNKKVLFNHLLSDYHNYSLETLTNYCESNACLFVGSASDYAYEYISDCYDIDNLSMYFDYDALGRDLVINSAIVEIGCNLYWTNPNDIY